MKLPLDTNIIFSILIGGRKIRKLFLEARNKTEFYTPATMLEEIEKLLPKAAHHVNTQPEILREIYNTLVKPRIKVISEQKIPEEIRWKARELAGEFDPDDWPFVALAMHLEIPLWTGDKKILELAARTNHKHFTTIDTEGVEMLLEGKSIEEVRERMKEKYRD